MVRKLHKNLTGKPEKVREILNPKVLRTMIYLNDIFYFVNKSDIANYSEFIRNGHSYPG